MELFGKTAALCIVCAVLALLIRKKSPEFAFCAVTACCAVCLLAAAELIAAFWLAHSDYVQTREESLDDLRAPSSDTESTGGEGNHVVS